MTDRHSNHGLRKICDCSRRTWAKCGHSWHFSFKWEAVHHRFSIDRHAKTHIDRKADAEDIAADLRTQIKNGTFGQPTPRAEMTVRQLADAYVERFVQVEHTETQQQYKWVLNRICRTVIPSPTGTSAPFGDWRVADVVTDTIERFREVRRSQGTGVVGVNRQLGLLRALWNWSLRTGYTTTSPFKRGSEPVVKLSDEAPRSRRLQTEEVGPLLAACGPHLRACVEAALETGMRLGEILSLQWSQVEGMTVNGTAITWAPKANILLTADKTKTNRDRRIPISTRLRAILEMRRFDPANHAMPMDAYVFGNVIGQQQGSIKRAWTAAVLRAHGHTPGYADNGQLNEAARAALATIDLHFHDLRREAGSRWLEGGVPLQVIRDWLGHTNIAQTSTYLASTAQTQHDAMRQYEARRAAEAAGTPPKGKGTRSNLQELATEARKGGRKSPRPTTQPEELRNETTRGRQTTIM
jgi:integrase